MKLLLTSSGITNKSIEKALRELVGEEIKTAFIPTAANYSDNDKSWLIEDFQGFMKLGFFTLVDIAALEKKDWLPRLQKVNVIVLGGGSASYLMDKIKKSGFDKEIKELSKTKVIVGISAGSIALAERLWGSSENLLGGTYETSPPGLGLTKINTRAHYLSEKRPNYTKENISRFTKNSTHEIYAIDNDTAIKIVDDNIEVISEGKWEIFPEKD